jgi:hypothetical protein
VSLITSSDVSVNRRHLQLAALTDITRNQSFKRQANLLAFVPGLHHGIHVIDPGHENGRVGVEGEDGVLRACCNSGYERVLVADERKAVVVVVDALEVPVGREDDPEISFLCKGNCFFVP